MELRKQAPVAYSAYVQPQIDMAKAKVVEAKEAAPGMYTQYVQPHIETAKAKAAELKDQATPVYEQYLKEVSSGWSWMVVWWVVSSGGCGVITSLHTLMHVIHNTHCCTPNPLTLTLARG